MAKNIDIPDDWEVKKLGEVVNINLLSLKDNTDPNYSFTYIDLSSVNQGKIDIPIKQICFKEAPSRARRIIEMDNIIIATVRPNLQGFAYIDFPCKDYIVSTGFAVLSYKNNMNMKFLYNMFYSNILMQQINGIITGSNYPAINSLDIKNFRIPVPPLAEQEKIAEILSLWDKAIEQTKELIEYKEKQKKGLMQNLLTGKKRLQGWTDKWKTIKLGEVANFISGYSFSSDDFIDEGIALIKISNIQNDNINIDNNTVYLPIEFKDKYHKFIIKTNDLLIAMSGATTGKMGVFKQENIALLNQRVGIIRAKENFCQNFLIYILRIYTNKILEMAYGGAQPNISSNDIYKIKISIPISFNEQKAIADILCKADEEMELLNKQLDLYTEQKKGLMQNLLTGKVRV